MAEVGTLYEILPSRSAADDFPTDIIYEENVGDFKDVPIIKEIVEEMDFDTEEKEIIEVVLKSVLEGNELPVSDEISFLTDINKETNEDVRSVIDYSGN